MKKIELEDFCNYHFLSNLNITPCGKSLLFTDTKVNADKSDYMQRIMRYDLVESKLEEVIEYHKRNTFFVLGHGDVLTIKDDPDNKFISTCFQRICPASKQIKGEFSLPLAVNDIVSLNDDYYLVLATIDVKEPDYYLYDDERKQAYLLKQKNDEDYLLIDEYPFVYNGAGVINGNRSALFLVEKNTLKIERITDPKMDVESYDFKQDKILYSGNAFTGFKGPTSFAYEYDLNTKETKCLFTDSIQINRVFYDQDKITVIGIKDKPFGDISYSDFYEVEKGQLVKVFHNELSLFNTTGTDCRFGRTKNFIKKNGNIYFISTVDSRAALYQYVNHKLVPVSDFEGTCDDIAIGKDIYVIAMVGQDLQEVYKLVNGKPVALTKMNDLSEYYVAKPHRIDMNTHVPFAGWALLPEDYSLDKLYPAILDIHGGPKCAYGEIFYHEMQYWVNKGYIVFFANPRGSDGRGYDFANLSRQYGGIDYQDLMDFTDKVLKIYPNIDKNRLGVTGGSYGGFMTNWIVTQTDRFKCAASQRSISNWVSEVGCSDYGIDFPISHAFTDIYHCQDELWMMSPLKYANNVKTPLLFIHSSEDYRCPFGEALQFYTAIKCRGVETKIVGFKGENHELSRSGKPAHRIRRLSEITSWMDQHLI